MSMFIDLDEVIVEDFTVKLAGQEYRLPGDVPVESMLRLARAWDRLVAGEGDSDENVAELSAQALALFRIRQPDLEGLPLGVGQIGTLITRLYGIGDEEAPAAVDPPKAGPERGTTPTPRKKRPRAAAKSRGS